MIMTMTSQQCRMGAQWYIGTLLCTEIASYNGRPGQLVVFGDVQVLKPPMRGDQRIRSWGLTSKRTEAGWERQQDGSKKG
jgi:hypothetical protein